MSLSIKYNYKCLVYSGVKERFLAWLITKIHGFESRLRIQTPTGLFPSHSISLYTAIQSGVIFFGKSL